jgi:8-oxo-dGTP pyrophosphatase MutT (NUDIX family)
MEESPWITHQTETKYDNPWIRVTESQVTNPSGGAGIYGVVHFKNRAVGVIPIDSEGYTWLVGQYRYCLDSYEWEIPAGGCPEGESPEATAVRELEEETGLLPGSIRLLMSGLTLSNSVTDERADIFVAENLVPGESRPEETERLSIRKLPLSEAIEMAMDGRITDSMSVMGLLRMAVGRCERGSEESLK